MIARDHSQHHGVNRPDHCLAIDRAGLERLRQLVDRQRTTSDLALSEHCRDPGLFTEHYCCRGNDVALQ